MSDKITVKNYDKHADLYSSITYNIFSQYHLNLFESYLKGEKVLDAGTGSGRDAEYLLSLGYKVIAIDASKGILKNARKVAKGASFRNMDLRELKFKAASFDGIWCCASLHHERKKHAEKVISGFAKILKKEGVLYVSVKEGKGEGFEQSANLAEAKVWVARYTQMELEELVLENGFELIKGFTEEFNRSNWVHLFARKTG